MVIKLLAMRPIMLSYDDGATFGEEICVTSEGTKIRYESSVVSVGFSELLVIPKDVSCDVSCARAWR